MHHGLELFLTFMDVYFHITLKQFQIKLIIKFTRE